MNDEQGHSNEKNIHICEKEFFLSNARDSTIAHAPDIGDDLPHGRRSEGGQTELDSQSRIDQSARLDHYEVVHEAEADHGDGTGEKKVLKLGRSRFCRRGRETRRRGSEYLSLRSTCSMGVVQIDVMIRGRHGGVIHHHHGRWGRRRRDVGRMSGAETCRCGKDGGGNGIVERGVAVGVREGSAAGDDGHVGVAVHVGNGAEVAVAVAAQEAADLLGGG